MNEQQRSGDDSPDRIEFSEHVTLYPRGEGGIWTADFHYIDNCGRRQHGRKSMKTRNRRVAERKARELDDELSRLGSPINDVAVVTTITSAIEAFLESKKTDGKARKTLVKYRGELEHFAAFLSDRGIRLLSQIMLTAVDAYKAHRKANDNLEPYTLHNHLIILKGWMKWAKKRKLVSENPLAELEVRTPRRRRHPAATHDQVCGILDNAFGIVFAVMMTLACTGLRIGELIALRPQDVDLESGVIHVRDKAGWDSKTDASQRDVPIHRRVLAVLIALKRKKSVWFFSSTPSSIFPLGNHPLNPRDVNVVFQILAKKAGYPVGRDVERGLTLHSLRRYFKTFSLDNGVPKPMVDFWMGHRNLKDMDQFYYDPIQSQNWMEKLPFGEPNAQDLVHLNGQLPKGERI